MAEIIRPDEFPLLNQFVQRRIRNSIYVRPAVGDVFDFFRIDIKADDGEPGLRRCDAKWQPNVSQSDYANGRGAILDTLQQIECPALDAAVRQWIHCGLFFQSILIRRQSRTCPK